MDGKRFDDLSKKLSQDQATRRFFDRFRRQPEEHAPPVEERVVEVMDSSTSRRGFTAFLEGIRPNEEDGVAAEAAVGDLVEVNLDRTRAMRLIAAAAAGMVAVNLRFGRSEAKGGKKKRKSRGKKKRKSNARARSGNGGVCLHSLANGQYKGCKPVCTDVCKGAGQACEHEICGPKCPTGTEDRQCKCPQLCDPACYQCDGEHGVKFICSCDCMPDPKDKTCKDKCGVVKNNCGQDVDCGACPVCPGKCKTNVDCPQPVERTGNGSVCVCDTKSKTGGEHNCVECVPEAKEVTCHNKCGEQPNNCGQVVNCGTCDICPGTCHNDVDCPQPSEKTSGGPICICGAEGTKTGGGEEKSCQDCVPNSDQTTCEGKCGIVKNNCRQPVDCGNCGNCLECRDHVCVETCVEENDNCGGEGSCTCCEGLTCQNGKCKPQVVCVPAECPTAPVCQVATCVENQCVNAPDASQNGKACGEGKCCKDGACVPCGGPPPPPPPPPPPTTCPENFILKDGECCKPKRAHCKMRNKGRECCSGKCTTRFPGRHRGRCK